VSSNGPDDATSRDDGERLLLYVPARLDVEKRRETLDAGTASSYEERSPS
jgi:hypothetical protein